ncbi:MAG: BadF/BadG/BcrA/BcrD ATPase family protein [Granulosicoccus sp.]
MAVIVVVDGGASCCRLAAYTQDGEQLATLSIDRHASLTLGVHSAWQHIQEGLLQLQAGLGETGPHHCDRLVMGLAGSLQQQKRSQFLQLIPRSLPVTLVTDGYAQLLGATSGEPGICLAVGTGSVLHWLDETGQSGMAGGWGFPVGDQGSGAWIGMRTLQYYVDSRDGRQCVSTLMTALEQHVGTDVSAIQKWTTKTCSTELARLSPLVFEHVEIADEVACLVRDEAVEKCVELISLAPEHLPLYIAGSVGERLITPLEKILGKRVRPGYRDALHGLWLLSQVRQ